MYSDNNHGRTAIGMVKFQKKGEKPLKKMKTIQLPRLPNELSKQTFQPSEDPYYARCLFESDSIKNITMPSIYFQQVKFKQIHFENISFPNIDLMDIVFDHCDLSNIDFSGGRMHRVQFINCKMLGANFSETTLENVAIDTCQAGLSSYGFSRFKQVGFRDSFLENSDFYECQF